MSLAIPEPNQFADPADHGRANGPRPAPAALVPDAQHDPLASGRLAAAAVDDPVLQRRLLGRPLRPVPRAASSSSGSPTSCSTRSSSTCSACSSCRSRSCCSSRRESSPTPRLFHSREGAFLLTTPATTDRIFAYKFAEAVAISSWGFFLLGSPLMAAYGLTIKAPAAFYAMFMIYLFMFVLIAGSLGAIAAIVVANIFPKRQKLVLAAGGDHDAWPGGRVWRSGSGGRRATR